MFHDDTGQLRSMQASWTDIDAPDAFTLTAANRSCLRADDLLELARLIDQIAARDGPNVSSK